MIHDLSVKVFGSNALVSFRYTGYGCGYVRHAWIENIHSTLDQRRQFTLWECISPVSGPQTKQVYRQAGCPGTNVWDEIWDALDAEFAEPPRVNKITYYRAGSQEGYYRVQFEWRGQKYVGSGKGHKFDRIHGVEVVREICGRIISSIEPCTICVPASVLSVVHQIVKDNR